MLWTHRGAYLHALGNVIETGLTAESVFLWTVPMFHGNGWCFPWALVAAGGTQVCLRKVEPALVWELIDTYGITHYNGAPTVHLTIANHPAAHRLPHPVTVGIGGAPPSPTLLARLRELNLQPIHYLRPHRDRTVHRQRVAPRVGDALRRRTGRAASLARDRAA